MDCFEPNLGLLGSLIDLDELKRLKNRQIKNLQTCLEPILQKLCTPTSNVQKGVADNSSEKSPHKSTEFRKKGNDLYVGREHDKVDHEMILHFYSKSIAYAPQDSEELALAYSNRSALWLHVHKNDLCKIDVERALKITKSNDLKKKLISRQKKCLESSIGIPQGCKTLPFPAFEPSKTIPCAADSIELAYNEKQGRHFIATRDIKPGEIVLSEESSFVCVRINRIYLVCAHCLAFAWAGIPCDFCVFTIYCSETCKKEAWTQYHDIMCSKLPIIHSAANYSRDIFTFLYSSTRMMDTLIKKDGTANILREAEKIDKEKDWSLDKLMTEAGSDCRGFRFVYNLANCKIDDEKEHTTSLMTIFHKLNYIIDLNAFMFQAAPPDDDLVCNCYELQSCIANQCPRRGMIMGPCSSLFNHSCIPNVRQILLPGPKIVMLTMRPVQKGEQLFICYGPSASNTHTTSRQEELRREYFFNCECRACQRNMPDSYPPKVLEKTKKKVVSRMNKVFGKDAGMLYKPVKTWYYNEKLYRAAVKMCEFLHNNFDEWESFFFSGDFRFYMQQCFLHLYSDHLVNFPSAC